jgi:hypothetical protein
LTWAGVPTKVRRVLVFAGKMGLGYSV